MTNIGDTKNQTIAIIGGTGKEGKGLAYRWALSGFKIIIGSRKEEKAKRAANTIQDMFIDPVDVVGMINPEAAKRGNIVVLTVPYKAHRIMLQSLKQILQGKILIDVTVPLVPPKVTKVQMPPAGSAAQEAQEILGNEVQVVSAFQNISFENLLNDDETQCDVFVCGKTRTAREVVLKLVRSAGLVGWDAGQLENSVVAEGLTSILIGINKQYGVTSSGIQITGVPRPE